ncbi:hypothetical protein AB0W38_00445 [Aliarcobacter butzleri]|uniref:hypothetical protein n=1 Tax=Aliarcobacter butzleri TaxID=28197 RepID=UPI00344E4DFB
MRTLRRLLEIWEGLGYDSFKAEIREIGLLKKGFTITEIRKTILEDRELMENYIQVSAYEVRAIPYKRN